MVLGIALAPTSWLWQRIRPQHYHQFIAVLLILQEGRGVQVILVNEKNHRGVLHFTNDFKPPFDVERDPGMPNLERSSCCTARLPSCAPRPRVTASVSTPC